MISPKVDLIKNTIARGQNIVHPYDFEIILPTGNETREIEKKFLFSKQNVLDMNAAVRSFTLPSRTSAKQSVYYGGPLRQFPYISTYDGEINMTLLMRRDDPLLYALHAWQELAIPTQTNTLQYQDFYTMDMQLMIRSVAKQGVGPVSASSDLGEPGSPTIQYNISNVWCETIGQIQMSNESANEALLYNVVLCYRDFRTSTYDGNIVKDMVVTQPATTNSQNPQQINTGPVINNTLIGTTTVFDASPGTG